ncbi:MAG: rhodanese-like domain-containing protein [Pirellulaceae bacterium]|nr:rhodanese-like domain-containing protein [Pirellulaceae bacterium]
MNRFRGSLIVVFAFSIVLFSMVWLNIAGPALAADHTKDSLDKVGELVAAKKAVLIDVREKVEWDAGHIQGAKFVPMSKLKGKLTDEQLLELLPADKVLYLYCAGGYRCLDVAEMLEGRKLQLRALKQGYQVLLKEGFPNEKPEAEKAEVRQAK